MSPSSASLVKAMRTGERETENMLQMRFSLRASRGRKPPEMMASRSTR